LIVYSRRTPAKVFPKISTLPQRPSAANVHLERYKLTIEQTRLQDELQALQERQRRLQRRLSQLEGQLSELSGPVMTPSLSLPVDLAGQLSDCAPTSDVYLPSCQAAAAENYSTLLLEY
jgi:ABC-type phosphate transport system auxiliary subunit